MGHTYMLQPKIGRWRGGPVKHEKELFKGVRMLEDEIRPAKSLHQQMFPEQHKEMLRGCTEAGLEKEKAIHKFKFFFAGLIFAVLSFVIQFPVKTSYK